MTFYSTVRTPLSANTVPRLQGVLFDLDGTLYDYNLCHREALEYTAHVAEKKLGIDVNTFIELYKTSRAIVHKRLQGTAASHSRLLYFCELVFCSTGEPNLNIATLLERAYWGTFYRAMNIYPGVLHLLKMLRSKSVSLALVTDMTAAIQFKKLRILKLVHMFDVVVTSEEMGCEKPTPKIFKVCLEKMGIDAQFAIHVGDDYQRDIVGARAAGLKSVLFVLDNRVHHGDVDVNVVNSFEELARILIPQI